MSKDLMGRLDGLFSENEHKQLNWEGSFADYEQKLIANPQYSYNAGQRMLDMILAAGTEPEKRLSKIYDKEVLVYKFFSEAPHLPEEKILGLELPLMQFVSDLTQSAYELGKEKTLKLLHGPVGCSKSSFVKLLKRGMEAWSRTNQGAVYTLGFEDVPGEEGVQWCEMFEHPLHAIPEIQGLAKPRRDYLAKLNTIVEGDSKVRYYAGSLCPKCNLFFEMLTEEHGGDWTKVIANNIRVKRWLLSENDRKGITTFQPRDEKNIDSTELTGDVNYRKIVQYGSESDPRAFNFDGEILKANQGMIELVEIFKLPREFLYDFLELTADRTAKPPKYAKIFTDLVMIAHTNEPEFKKVQADETQEAIRDRTVVIDTEYLLDYTKEVRVYKEKFFSDDKLENIICAKTGKQGIHVAPHTFEMAALWAVMTRLAEPKKVNLELVDKAKLYAGLEVSNFNDTMIAQLQEHAALEREGMFGVSPRYVRNQIGNAITSSDTENCINPFIVLRELREGLHNYSLIADEKIRGQAKDYINVVQKELDSLLKEDIMIAVAADEDALEKLHRNYIENIKASIKKEKILDRRMGKAREPDANLMNSVEERVGIPENRREAYRIELMAHIGTLAQEGKDFGYRSNSELLKAYQKKLFDDKKDTIYLGEYMSSVKDPKMQKEIERIVENLEARGYCKTCAQDVLDYISDLLNRGQLTP